MTQPRDQKAPAGLLTAEQAANTLLEEARLQAWRTNGAQGLQPIARAGRPMYSARDVAGFLETLRGASLRPTTEGTPR